MCSSPPRGYLGVIGGGRKRTRKERSLVLRNWLQFLERAGLGVRQAPHGPRLELLLYRLKVQVMHSPRQVFGKPSLLLDERLVDQQFGGSCGQVHSPPLLDLVLQRPEVTLHPIQTNGQAVLQREVLGMLGQNRGIFPVKRQILAHEDPQADGA